MEFCDLRGPKSTEAAGEPLPFGEPTPCSSQPPGLCGPEEDNTGRPTAAAQAWRRGGPVAAWRESTGREGKGLAPCSLRPWGRRPPSLSLSLFTDNGDGGVSFAGLV